MTALNRLTAHALLEQLQNKKISAEDISRDVGAQIRKTESRVKAYVQVYNTPESGGPGACPIPVAIKDNMCMTDREITCCSRILKGFKAPYNATVIDKLNASGAVVTGTANMDEFAFGSSTENSCYGPTRNPWNLDCVPGGSSGGSAAAVAGHEAIWALGSDTGGSIRQPASFCGIVGVKPTYGRVSRYGLIAFASSLDQIGPLTRDVTDAALLLKIIAGHDERDSTSVDLPVPDYTRALCKDMKGVKVGIPKEYFIEGMQKDVNAAVQKAISVYRDLGAEFVDISLPHTGYSVATYYIIATAEASSNLARFDGVRYGLRAQPKTTRKSPIVDMYEETREQGFGDEAKRRIMLGTYSLSSGYYDAYYLRGQKVRTLIKQDFDRAFEKVDVIVTPTSPSTAFKIGERAADPLSMYLSDIYTIAANLSGIPAMSLPCGLGGDGLPVGLQVMAKPFDEEMMFRTAYAYEQATNWHTKIAPAAA